MRTRSSQRVFAAALIVSVLTIAVVTTAQSTAWWPFAGQNLFNTHSHNAEDQISAANVATIVEKWSLTTAGNVAIHTVSNCSKVIGQPYEAARRHRDRVPASSTARFRPAG